MRLPKSPNLSGIEPLSALFLSHRYRSSPKSPNAGGIEPSSSLSLSH